MSKDALGDWRKATLDAIQETPAYGVLSPILQRVVRRIVLVYLNPVAGAFPSQSTLAQHFKVTRQTMNVYLSMIADEGVLQVEGRRRRTGPGSGGGAASNVYRPGGGIHIPYPDTTPDTTSDTTPDSTPDSSPDTKVLRTQLKDYVPLEGLSRDPVEARPVNGTVDRGVGPLGLPEIPHPDEYVPTNDSAEPLLPPGVTPEQAAKWAASATERSAA